MRIEAGRVICNTPAERVFTPERDVFELLAEAGVDPVDILTDGRGDLWWPESHGGGKIVVAGR